MTRNIILIILTLGIQSSFAQKRVETVRPFFGLPSYLNSKAIEIDSLSLLPGFIQANIQTILDSTLTDFAKVISFDKGQILDLDFYFKDKPSIDYSSEKRILPKYQLFFTLKDSSINCCGYSFEMSFDQYGQLTYLAWPRQGFNHREDFKTIKQAEIAAVKTAKSKGFKTREYVFDFGFDDSTDQFYWDFSFLQKATGDNYNYTKEYKTIRINPISLNIIDITNMTSCGVSCGGRL